MSDRLNLLRDSLNFALEELINEREAARQTNDKDKEAVAQSEIDKISLLLANVQLAINNQTAMRLNVVAEWVNNSINTQKAFGLSSAISILEKTVANLKKPSSTSGEEGEDAADGTSENDKTATDIKAAPEIKGKGWEILITRLREEKRGSSTRTVSTYQVYHDGAADAQLAGMICEPPGPGDNTENGDDHDLRILPGIYPLYTQSGTKYKTIGYKESGSSSAVPRPGIELMNTGDRTEILIHPAQGFLWSVGCFNVTDHIADASSNINYVESRKRIIALIDDMATYLGNRFPAANGKVIPDTFAVVRNAKDFDSPDIPVPTEISNDLLSRLVTVYAGENIRHPLLKAVTLAQWLLESGRATSKLATEHYNFGGLKWRAEMVPVATKVLYLAHDGWEDYCKFATLESFVNGYWAFINRSPYTGWEEHAQSAADYIRFIGPIYAPANKFYADHVLALVPEAKLLLSNDAGSSNGQQSTGTTDLGTIVIDPGHGGTKKNGGSSPNNAISASGVKEKKLALDFALILQQSLLNQAKKANEKISVVLTRNHDVNPSITDRAGTSFSNKAALFLSIHFNGGNKSVRGTETFYRAPENGNLNLADDKEFAKKVQDAVFKTIAKLDNGANDRGTKPDTKTKIGALGVLNDKTLGNDKRQKKCRAALLEIEFISNPDADRLLVSGSKALSNRTAIMDALASTLRKQLKIIAN